MKLRIRSTAKKETIRVESPNDSSLFDLKTLIASKLSSSFSHIFPESVHLSLNRSVELIAPSTGESLTALGLISGDLLFFSLESGFFSTPSNPASTPSVIDFTDPLPVSLQKTPVDDMDIQPEAEKGKINGNMELTAVASQPNFGVSSQKRAKPSTHGEANAVKTVWKKAKAVSFGGASVCRPNVSPANSSQGKVTPSATLLDKGPLQSCKGKDAAGGTPPRLRSPGILSEDLSARSKELSPSPPFGRCPYDHVAAISISPAKSSSQGKSTSLVAPMDKGPLQSPKGMDAAGGTSFSSRTPGILSDDLSTASGARSKDLPPQPQLGGVSYDHVATISASPTKTSQCKATPLVTLLDKGPMQSSTEKDAARGSPPSSRTPGIVSDNLSARSKELSPSPPFGMCDHIADVSASPAKCSSQGNSTSLVAPRDKGPLQPSKGVDAAGGTPPSSRTPGILSGDSSTASGARLKELPSQSQFGGVSYDHVATISSSPARTSQCKATPLVTLLDKGPLQSSKGMDAASGTPPSSRTPGILSGDLSSASRVRLKELTPQPQLDGVSYDHVVAISASPTEASSQGKATPLMTPHDNGPMQSSDGKDAVGETPPSSHTPGILSEDLSVASEARSKEQSPPPSFGRWMHDHIASNSVNSVSPAKFSSQGKATPSVTPRAKLSSQSSEGKYAADGIPPNSHTPGILSDDLPSASEARSMEVPLPPFGKWPYDHVAAISAPINGPTAVGDLQSRLVAYVADMEARMRIVELSNLSRRVTALEARVALVEGYEPRLQAAEERCSVIADMGIQISEIRHQVDHLVMDFSRVTPSIGTSSEQALVLELVRQGKQHLAQAEALFQSATTLDYSTLHAPNP